MDKDIIQRLRDKDGKMCGMLLAFVDTRPERGGRQVLVGYSKCHPYLDRFDKAESYRLAVDRAFTLSDRLTNWKDRAIMTEQIFEDHVTGKKVKPATWPVAVLEALPTFLLRCKRYFKDKTLTPWAQSLVDELGVEV